MRIESKLPSMLAAMAAIAICALTINGLASAGTVRERAVKLKGNHPTELARLGPTVHADPAMQLHLTITLGIHDQAKLDQLLADQQNPSSSQYHRWLTPSAIQPALRADPGADGRGGPMARQSRLEGQID